MQKLILLTSALAATSANAMDLLVKDTRCESRAITADFEYICNGDGLCTFGEEATMEGQYNYYGLDTYEVTNADYMAVDASIYFFLAGYTYEQVIFDQTAVPICNEAFEAAEDNQGDCPSDGSYKFVTQYDIPSPENDLVSWAGTGWSGEIVVNMYLNGTDVVLGKCTMEFETMVTGAYENGILRTTPSAKMAAIGSAVLLALMFLCMFWCCCCRPSAKKRSLLDESESHYNRMGNRTGDVVV